MNKTTLGIPDALTYPDKFSALDDYGYKVFYISNNDLAGKRGHNALNNARFNGAITEFKGRTYMVFRCYSEVNKGGNGNIGICEFDKDYNILWTRELDLPEYCPSRRQYEDARLFEHKGKLWISYVSVDYDSDFWAGIQVSRLTKDFKVDRNWTPKYGGNFKDKTQKNWIFFPHNNKLYCIYNSLKGVILEVDDKTGECTELHRDKAPIWLWGTMRGGTTPIKTKGGYLSFFHSSVPHQRRKRRYAMAPYMFSDSAPFQITAMPKEPFMWSSELNPIADPKGFWVPIVLFPMGCVDRGDCFDVSMGVNDLYNAIVRIPKVNVWDALYDVRQAEDFDPRYFYAKPIPNQLHAYSRPVKAGATGMEGIIRVDNPEALVACLEHPETLFEITKEQYYNYL